jgi:hypothetical protein
MLRNVNKLSILFFFLCLLFGTQNLQAQRFEGAAILGFNAAQIDGDNLWGYNKVGLTGGLKLAYRLQEPWNLSMEFLYSQRGSQSELSPLTSGPISKINLQYIEVPVLVSYKDWWIEGDDFFRVNAEAGLSYGYLFGAEKSVGGFQFEAEDFLQHDISIIIGAHYFFTRHLGMGLRYTRSLTRLYENPDSGERDLLGYFLSFRGIYQF